MSQSRVMSMKELKEYVRIFGQYLAIGKIVMICGKQHEITGVVMGSFTAKEL